MIDELVVPQSCSLRKSLRASESDCKVVSFLKQPQTATALAVEMKGECQIEA